MNWIKNLVIRIPFFSTGKSFDPTYQERTSAMEDLLKNKDAHLIDLFKPRDKNETD